MIDLRSDTVTRPTEVMLDAMRGASLGDDSRDGDTTVRRLEGLAAECTGKESAAFMPSGTMTNLVAVLAHAQRGGQILLEAGAHMLHSELGGMSALAGVHYRAVQGVRGAMDVEELMAAIRPPSRHSLGTALVCMETSHNRAGGTVLSIPHMRTVYDLAQQHGIPVHTDGARVFNAAVALDTSVSSIAQHTDTLCFCISKGLSAPVGSLLCGSAEFIDRARAFRRMVGGNMRQAGLLAAAGVVALETMVDRLQADHATAKQLASKLHSLNHNLVTPTEVETNIVRVQLPRDGPTADEWSDDLRKAGVLVSPCDRNALRFVTHRHIDDADVDETATVFASCLASAHR